MLKVGDGQLSPLISRQHVVRYKLTRIDRTYIMSQEVLGPTISLHITYSGVDEECIEATFRIEGEKVTSKTSLDCHLRPLETHT